MNSGPCCCEKTDGKDKMLGEIVARHKKSKGSLIPILHEVQSLYGYLPADSRAIIAKELNIPLSEVFGVITFYHHFSLKPKGEYNISVCMGTACYVKGAGEILDKFKEKLKIDVGGCTEDGKFSLEACRCLGACGLAPVITVNDVVYGRLTKDDVDGIVQKYENSNRRDAV